MNVESCSLSSMLRGLDYGSNGVLQDDTGHSWSRVSDWVEPADAEKLVREGTRFAIQGCLAAPVAGRAERFRRDVQAHMVTPLLSPKPTENEVPSPTSWSANCGAARSMETC